MRLVILDRDGTINEDSDDFVTTAEEWRPIPGALEAIARLHRGGWRAVIASNQSGIGRGLIEPGALVAMQDKMRGLLSNLGGEVDGFFFCPHRPEEGCNCRKPKPGLLVEIGRRYQTSLEAVPVIGDAVRDMEAAMAVHARPMLVLTGHGQASLEQLRAEGREREVEVFADLAAAADALLREHGGEPETEKE
jgi:D-glycero-D-manno-heptose 1,7-bisphosphate phosphatase